MIATRKLVHILLTFWALLARLLDHLLRGLVVLLPLLIPPVVIVTSLASMPGDVVFNAMTGGAGLTLELSAVLVVYLPRSTCCGQTPPEVR